MKTYEVIKINSKTGQEINYGFYGMEDVKLITRGYKNNGLFYERKNSKWFFCVTEYYL